MSKKTIYIIIIVVCFAGAAGVLYYGYGNSSKPPQIPVTITTSTTPTATPVGNTGSSGTATVGSAPSVFPADTKFDWSLLNSDTFKNLQGIPDLTLDPKEIGRPNPFSK